MAKKKEQAVDTEAAAADAAAAAAAAEAEPKTAEQLAADEAADEAAFNEGFKANEDGNEPAPAKPDEGTDAGADAGTGEQKQEAGAPAAAAADAATEPVMFGMKESEIKAILATASQLNEFRTTTEKELQKVFGKFGDIQRQITATSASAGQVLTKREINAQALKKLGADYPEIAELLASDLSEVLSTIPVASPTQPGPTQEQIDVRINTIVDARVNAVEEKINERMLTRFHKDWEDIAKSDDLKLWLSTQQAEYREQFLGTNDAVLVSDGLDKFKTWREQGHAQKLRNKNRLENAIPAKSSGAPAGSSALSDEAAFIQGFNEPRSSG